MKRSASADIDPSPAARLSDQPQTSTTSETQDGNEPIAVIGMSCRFPKAPGIDAFWKLICDGVDAITEIPKERWDVSSLYSPDLASPGKMNTRWGGFLEQVDQFDAQFFQISPREASQVDPQQRLMLELSWEALEDAGIVPHSLQGSLTGVFFGAMWHDYDHVPADPLPAMTQHTATGQSLSVVPGRVSYALGLRGPSVAFNTSCSSSLVAVHYARRSLQRAECPLALAGGVNLLLSPHNTVALSKLGALSVDGRCKAFAAQANGFVRSEGGGVVVLKTLRQALADGDRVYCVLLGSAVNNNGVNNGLSAPSTPAQEELLQTAYSDAGISPQAVQYVETHGTGTSLGDPTEAQALGTTLGKGRPAEEPLIIGSVKTNLGHLETAAGIAGLIKVALALKHQAIPPNLHFEQPNPKIPFEALRLHVPTRLRPWPRTQGRAIAGVSSFGIGGTNSHVVVAAPDARPVPLSPAADDPVVPLLLPLSAHSQAALKEQAGAMCTFLEGCASLSAADIAYTAGARRSHLPHRLAAVADTKKGWIAQLQAFLQDQTVAGLAHGKSPGTGERKIVFVFPGQGGQWLAMGKQLLQDSPVFRQQIMLCDKEMQSYCDFSLVEVLQGSGKAAELERVDVVQPALFAMQVGLSAVLRSWGVEPGAVVGHSLGEVAAACVAGWLSLEQGCRIICQRSKLVRRTSGQGAMALVELPAEKAREALRDHAGQVEVGAINGPRTTVISGERQAVQAVMRKVEQAGGYCRLVKVDYASHSPQMEPLSGELLQALAGVVGTVGQLAMYSTVSGEKIAEPPSAEYWQRNLRQTVQFYKAVQELGKDGYDTCIEISPHPVLLPALTEALQESVPRLLTLGVMRRDHGGSSELLSALGTLYVHGAAPSWPRLYPQPGRVVALPRYPFQRTRHWIQTPASSARPTRPSGSHPLLGPPLQLSTEPGVRIFELELRLDQLPYLRDHRVRQAVVLPATAYLEMARAAAEEVFKTPPGGLEAVLFQEMMTFGAESAKTVQVVLHEERPGQLRFAITSREEADGSWRCHCRGRLNLLAAAPDTGEGLSAVHRRCAEPLGASEFYTRLSAQGLEYGPAFQRVTELFKQGAEALGKVQLDPQQSGGYGLHPALLDGCLQVIIAALDRDAVSGPVVPIAIAAARLHRPLPSTVWSQAELRVESAPASRRIKAELRLFSESGELLAEIAGLELQVLAGDTSAKTRRQLQYTWRPAALQPVRKPTRPARFLLLADEGGVAAALRQRLQDKGATVELRPARAAATLDRVLKDHRYTAVVYLGSLDGPVGKKSCASALTQSFERDYGGVLEVLHSLIRLGLRDPPRLWLVTRGVHASGAPAAPLSPAGGLLWGLGRTIAYEHPELSCTRVDLSPSPFPEELEALEQELLCAEQEEEIALRESGRRVARLLWESTAPAIGDSLLPAAGRPFRLEIETPGILDGLKLRPLRRRPPGPGEVEVEVEAASLNFLDVLMAMGIYPGQEPGPTALGRECTGRIVGIGAQVSGFAKGDPVIALTPGAFASHVTLPATLVVRRPPSLSAEQAAAVSLALMTAYYGLHTLGRMKKGDRVLIHSAAGGTGLAALRLAQRAGAVVFATAGSAEKRAYLQSLGIEHVMDSRSLGFAQEVSERTGGRGVDIVLNSLTGPAIEKSLAALAPYGRFIELGKRDIYEDAPINLGHFRKKLSYVAVDLAGMLEERPEETAQLFRHVVQEVGAGQLPPPQIEVFPISEAQAAIRRMAQGQHLGKVVLSLADPNARIAAAAPEPAALRADATYLITGGLGGLGLALAKWLGEQGARHLLLLGRRGADSIEQQEAVRALEQTGMQVVVMRADVSQRGDVEAALQHIAAHMPALRGVVHAAGILDDGLLAKQDKEQLARVILPKAIGAWNLHALTQDVELDFFVLYSSVAALLGSPGQGNYAAANSFVDALAHYRRGLGLPALSINWGTFTDVGLAAAQHNRGQRLAARGMTGMAPAAGTALLAKLLFSPQVQVGVVDLDVRQWVEFYPQVAASSLLRELLQTSPAQTQAAAPAQALQARLRSADPEERRTLLEKYLREQLGQVVRMNPEQLDSLTPFKNLGVDSLMGLEFRNRLEAGLGLKLSAALIWTYPDVARLAAHLSGRFSEPAAAPPEAPAAPPANQPSPGPDLDALSDAELARLGDELLD